ncbi:MAG: TIGR03618 family F420-dependent PPOX class oxidoreductase [Candidatus Rokuibacteriota bacterium]
MTIPESVRSLIASGPPAHLTTLNADGSPQVTVVWVGLDGDEIVSAHLQLHRKVKNVRRDPRVALSLLGPGKNARVTQGGAVPILEGLARIYMGPDVHFPPPALRDRPGFVTRITPRRHAGVGPWSSPA